MDMEESINEIQAQLRGFSNQIQEIKDRNSRVEINKRWETSKTRFLSLTLIMYITMVLLFYVINSMKPFQDALIPTIGYMLSTFSLNLIRSAWEKANK